jgi:hypothetical protein
MTTLFRSEDMLKSLLVLVLSMFLYSSSAVADDQAGYPCGADVTFYDFSNYYNYQSDAEAWCYRLADLFKVPRGNFCKVNYDSRRYKYQGEFSWPFRFEGDDAWDVYRKIGDRHLKYSYKGENFRTNIFWDGQCKY